MNEKTLLAFKTITEFANDLLTIFAEEQHSLRLYCRLTEHTTFSHEKAILKHVEIFREFCVKNRDSILNKDYKNFKIGSVKYSDKVYIDFNKIFELSIDDKETTNTIWDHIFIISAILDPESKTTDIVKSSNSNSNSNSNSSENFLSDIISKVEENIDENSNPMDTINNIMSSGIFTDLVNNMESKLNSGELDINSLLGSVKNMVSDDIEEEEGGQIQGMMGAMETMINNLQSGEQNNDNNNNNNNNEQPSIDIAQIMSMIGPMMNNLNGLNINQIEDK
tara:strand:- start:30 stop:866 length:837 start_codon:yes stop_codon:yes gene_type:complete